MDNEKKYAGFVPETLRPMELHIQMSPLSFSHSSCKCRAISLHLLLSLSEF